MKWKTSDGQEIAVKDMANTHLLNTIKMIERSTEARNWNDGLDALGVLRTLRGDMAIMYGEHEIGRLAERKPHELYPIYPKMIAEANRRGLNVAQWCTRCQQFHAPDQKKCVTAPCDACQKYHPVPVNKFHRRALKCVAKE